VGLALRRIWVGTWPQALLHFDQRCGVWTADSQAPLTMAGPWLLPAVELVKVVPADSHRKFVAASPQRHGIAARRRLIRQLAGGSGAFFAVWLTGRQCWARIRCSRTSHSNPPGVEVDFTWMPRGHARWPSWLLGRCIPEPKVAVDQHRAALAVGGP